MSQLSAAEVLGENVDVAFAAWLAARSIGAGIDLVAAPAGWSAEEFAVASMIRARGRATTVELARWVAAPKTTVSSLLARFERRGDLERVANPDDGRSTLVSLTPAGLRTHQAIADGIATFSARLDAEAASAGVGVDRLVALRVAADVLRADLG